MKQTDVLIVGGGPVGLGAAIELARHGIEATLVERQAEPSHHPKARGFRVRTMELFRLWGVEPRLRELETLKRSGRFIFCESLAGEEYGRNPDTLDLLKPHSPTEPTRIGQDIAEGAMRERLDKESGITTEYGVECSGVAEGGDGVVATLTDVETGQESQITAKYMIAADGIGSRTRTGLGIEMEGIPLIAYWQSIYWHGDIDDLTDDRPCVQYITGAKDGKFVTVAMVDNNRWVTLLMLPVREEKDKPADLTLEQAEAIVRKAVGRQDQELEILDIATWRLSSMVAKDLRKGPVFLAGDAAHSLPPTGGFGMNTGLQDVHNLVWKLALVLKGQAEARLLDSYQPERWAVAKANTAWSTANAGVYRELQKAIVDEDKELLDKLLYDQRQNHAAIPQDLGFHYDDGAIVLDDETEPRVEADPAPELFTQIAAPGFRAPHIWLNDGDKKISTIDMFDLKFVVLTGPEGQAWLSAVDEIRSDLGIPIEAHMVGGPDGDLQDPSGEFLDLYGLGPSGAVLVRPDGHIAWRSQSGEADPEQRLRAILQTLGMRELSRT
jgi:putative polyketide hydroxylase